MRLVSTPVAGLHERSFTRNRTKHDLVTIAQFHALAHGIPPDLGAVLADQIVERHAPLGTVDDDPRVTAGDAVGVQPHDALRIPPDDVFAFRQPERASFRDHPARRRARRRRRRRPRLAGDVGSAATERVSNPMYRADEAWLPRGVLQSPPDTRR